jgi:hypothetical protein
MTIHTKIAMLGVCAALLASACEEKKPTAPAAPAPGAGTKLPTAPAPSQPAAGAPTLDSLKNAAGGALADSKEKAITAAQTAIDAAKTRIDAIKAKAAEIPAVTKPVYDKAVADLDAGLKGVQDKLANLKSAAADAWQGVSTDLQTALSSLESSIKSAMEQYSVK